MKIKIFSDLSTVLRRVERQYRFATARAITEAAKYAKADAVMRFPGYFKVRSSWPLKGFRVGAADRKTLTGWVGHYEGTAAAQRDADYMKRHAFGGDKGVQGKVMGIPQAGSSVNGVLMPRGINRERETKRYQNWAGVLIAQIKKARENYLVSVRNKSSAAEKRAGRRGYMRSKATKGGLVFLQHAKTPFVAVRTGKNSYTPLWFMVKKSVHIKKDWPFFVDAEGAYHEAFPGYHKKFVEQYVGGIAVP